MRWPVGSFLHPQTSPSLHRVCTGVFKNPNWEIQWFCETLLLENSPWKAELKRFTNMKKIGCFQKIGEKTQNGWCISWKTLLKNGWFERKPTIFDKTSKFKAVQNGKFTLNTTKSVEFLLICKVLGKKIGCANNTSWWLSFNPFETYAQIKLERISPGIRGWNLKKTWNHHLDYNFSRILGHLSVGVSW